jgi:uncharacterized protein YndB with AHSA1/START domain
LEVIGVERNIWIAAPIEKVWKAITDPAQIEIWFSPGMQWRGTSLQVGGKMAVYDPETNHDLIVQVVEKVDPPRQLVMRSEVQPPDTPHVTTWTLEEENGGTRLTLTFTGYELEPDSTRDKNMDENGVGFTMMLENIKAHVEGVSLPYPQGF